MELLPIDLNYLHSEAIGGVISQGLTVLYEVKPEKPVEYLAKWLLQYCKTYTHKTQFSDAINGKQKLLQTHIQQELEKKQQQEIEQLEKLQQEQKELKYQQYLKDYPYHQELLVSEFPNYISQRFNIDAIYICQLTNQKLDVDIDLVDDENAFLNQKAPKLLKYIGTTQSQNFLLNKYLTEQAVLTYTVLQPLPIEEGKIQEINKGCYIPDVVKEPKIYFHKFPKLGCYFAIPMIFETHLFEDAFDQALINRMKYNQEIETQTQEKQIKLKELEDAIQSSENEEQKQQLEKEYQTCFNQQIEIVEPQFLGLKQEYIVCGDTLGQDRQLTQKERDDLFDLVSQFGLNYELKEQELLSNDINEQIQYFSTVPEQLEETYLDKLNQYIEQESVIFEELKNTNQNQYNYEIECMKFDYLKQQFTTPEFASTFLSLTKRRIIKFSNIFKALLYLLGYKKEEITYENKLKWKEVCELIDQRFLAKLALINHKGPKQAPLQHATIFRLEKLVDIYDEEKVLNYNWSLSYLQKFLVFYCKLRREDVAIRKENFEQKKQQLQAAKDQVAQLNEQKEIELQNAKANFTGEEGEEFQEQPWLEQWEQEHPYPEIEEEPKEDVDDDLE